MECPSTSYCGLLPGPGPNASLVCGACPWGWRSVGGGPCERCEGSLSREHWLYLAFAALLPLLCHVAAVEWTATRKRTKLVLFLQHLSSFLESVAAGLGSLLLVSPNLARLSTCGSASLRDWYTSLLNPAGLRCTSEAVFPLYSLPLVYHGLGVAAMGVVRPAVLGRFRWEAMGIRRSVYAALYFLPLLSLAWAVLGGVLFAAWPYGLLLATLLSNALQLARLPEQRLGPLAKAVVSEPRKRTVLLGHCALLAFGLAGLTGLRLRLFLPLLLLIPLPTALYLLTAKLTHPKAQVHRAI